VRFNEVRAPAPAPATAIEWEGGGGPGGEIRRETASQGGREG
jgi:hypothetical protein